MSSADDYASEHFEIFGHHPLPNLVTGQGCSHPIHDALRQVVDAPGVSLSIDFAYRDMLSDDHPAMLANKAQYDAEVAELRSRFKAYEEEDEAVGQPKRIF